MRIGDTHLFPVSSYSMLSFRSFYFVGFVENKLCQTNNLTMHLPLLCAQILVQIQKKKVTPSIL